MSNRYFDVKLVRGTNTKWIKVWATSAQNAQYEAGRQHPGWAVADVRS